MAPPVMYAGSSGGGSVSTEAVANAVAVTTAEAIASAVANATGDNAQATSAANAISLTTDIESAISSSSSNASFTGAAFGLCFVAYNSLLTCPFSCIEDELPMNIVSLLPAGQTALPPSGCCCRCCPATLQEYYRYFRAVSQTLLQ